ncbi:MAG TPA: flavin reductase family protein [Actinobacteria bacterium]|nr:flavin reductase family protein [Actinomycetota bacterium]
MKKSIGTYERLYPNPVALISCSYKGSDNIITLAWVGTVCSNPPMISISVRPSRYSHELIGKSGEFVINIPDYKMTEICNFCGSRSGRDIDKFAACGLSKEKGFKSKTIMIKECPISIECIVRQTLNLGTHDVFIGEVISVNAEESFIYSDGDIDYEKLDMITYLMGNYYKTEIIK